jgi:hypothetical protein
MVASVQIASSKRTSASRAFLAKGNKPERPVAALRQAFCRRIAAIAFLPFADNEALSLYVRQDDLDQPVPRFGMLPLR